MFFSLETAHKRLTQEQNPQPGKPCFNLNLIRITAWPWRVLPGICAAVFMTGCADLGIKQALGFVRSVPNEFVTRPYTSFVVPPFIGVLPQPEHEQYQEVIEASVSARELQGSTATKQKAETPQDYMREFLGLDQASEDTLLRFSAQTEGLLYLSKNFLDQLKNKSSQTSQGIRIVLEK